jgi:hypothetical protein
MINLSLKVRTLTCEAGSSLSAARLVFGELADREPFIAQTIRIGMQII